jgi:hypothetical protein
MENKIVIISDVTIAQANVSAESFNTSTESLTKHIEAENQSDGIK